MTEWIKWEGGACPVPLGTLVDVQYRDNRIALAQPADKDPSFSTKPDASAAYWYHIGCNKDIVAYRLSEQVLENIKRGHLGAGGPPIREITPERRAELQVMADSAQVAIERGKSVKSNQTCTLSVVDTWPPDQRIGAYRHTVLKYLMNLDSEDMSAQEITEGVRCMEKLLEMLKGK